MDNVNTITVTPQTAYTEFTASVRVRQTKAEDGTYRGQRHGAFTAAVTVAADAVAKLAPGFYAVRTISSNVGVPGWALRVAARRMAADGAKVEVLAGGRGNASMIHIQ